MVNSIIKSEEKEQEQQPRRQTNEVKEQYTSNESKARKKTKEEGKADENQSSSSTKSFIDDLPIQSNSKYHSSNHPIPSLPPVPHHAPPEDSSELLSPWWSEEPPDVTEATEPEHNKPEDLSHFVVKFSRQATTKNGESLWSENCYLWTKEPQHRKESSLVNEIKQASAAALSSSSSSSSSSNAEQQKKTPRPGYPMNSQCTMVCLFRESQDRKKKKLAEMNLSSSWNPFYGNWLVVVNTRSGFSEHLCETDIIKKNSPDYYTIELGERFGRTGEDVTKFLTKTFTPVQELGKRYIESWKDGTQVGFFTRFMESAKRGDAFFLLRDSARRIVDNMVASNEKKKDDDDHKR